MDYEKIQKKLDSFKKDVVFKEPLNVNDIVDVIAHCTSKIGHSNETIYKNTKTIQCSRGRSRSAGDMYRIAKSYLKDVTYEDVQKTLDKLGNNINHSYCNDVNKVVYSSFARYNTTRYEIDEFLKENT